MGLICSKIIYCLACCLFLMPVESHCMPFTLKFCFICSMSEGNEFYTEWTESYESFDQMNLHENLLRGIYAYGTFSVNSMLCHL
jgi:hypothetical protein